MKRKESIFRMKKGQILEGTVEAVDFPNRGILHIEGERAVVKNALPGQKIRFAVQKKRNGRIEGRLLEVLEPSPLEYPADPAGKDRGEVCPHFGRCGGCLYQSLPYEEQLKIKEKQVRDLLLPVCGDGHFEGIKASPISTGYRNKMEFSFGDEYKGGPLALGMHRRGSFYDIVTTDDCRIVHPDFCRILTATLDYFSRAGVSHYRKLQHTGYLRHLLVRRAVKTGEILVALVTASGEALEGAGTGTFRGALPEVEAEAVRGLETGALPEVEAKVVRNLETEGLSGAETGILRGVFQGTEIDASRGSDESVLLEGWKDALEVLPLDGRLTGILHVTNDSLADVVRNDGMEILAGTDSFYEELLGMRFCVTPFSFFQTNSLGAEVLYKTVREYVGETRGKVVFDLYSGTGTIAQITAPVAEKVVGVEIVEEAVEAARENARQNGLSNCTFIAGDVLKVIGDLPDKPDLIILDPPRDGIHPKALQKIIGFGVERMVYVSCKPTSLVRDLEALQAGGYRVERSCCVDMFPATGNIEVVCLISKCDVK